MSRNDFRKAALVAAVALVCTASSATAQITVKNNYTVFENRVGLAGETYIFQLEKDLGFFSSECHTSSAACSFTNEHTIWRGGAGSVLFVDDSAFYAIDNKGEILASGGTFISADSAGTDLTVTNSGTIESANAILYRTTDGKLTVKLTDGVMNGAIMVADDTATDDDTMILTGGEYKGTATNLDIVRASSGNSTISGTINFATSGSATRKLEILSGAELYTSDLTVSDGTLTVQDGAVLSLGVDNTNTGTAVVTTGTSSADVSSGTIVVVPDRAFITSSYQTVQLIDNVSSANASDAVKVAPIYDQQNAAVSGNALSVEIKRSSTSPDEIIRDNGGSQNAAKFYKLAAESSNPTLYRAVASKVGVENAVAFSEELAPTTNGGAIALAQDSLDLSHENILRRLNTVSSGTGLNTGSFLNGKTLWMQGLYGEGDQDDRDRSDGSTLRGYASRITGFTIGGDTEVRHDLLAGAAVSIGQGTVNKNEVKDNTAMDIYMATLYGRWDMDVNSNTNLDIYLSYSLHKNRRERFFDVENAILNEATSDFDSEQYGLKAVLSRTLMFDEWAVTPLVGLHYGKFDIDAYEEKGSEAALKMDKQRYEIIKAGLGIGISRSFHYRNREIVPELEISGWHDFASDPVEVQTRFVTGGDSFLATGLEPEKTTWTASAGVTMIESEHFEMSTGYERSWKKGFHSDNVYFRAEYMF